ncbi:MAG: biliverdin-producing heme oxygenase [Verrucomicrobiaceae bacterium]|nr:MAG: biliverdin-producing heme oxygenase [Verrucomicrobiaceae bacterium]
MILEELRKSTQAIHEEMEQRLPLGRPDLSRETYRDLVKRFHGFIIPLEKQLLKSPGMTGSDFNYQERLKQPALEADAMALGLEGETQLASPAELPPLENQEQVFGCLYVIEGSTLGGQVISRSLREHLDIHPENGGAYFSGYGPLTGPRWKEFLSKLAEVADGADTQAITDSAVATFEALNHWLFADLSPRSANP